MMTPKLGTITLGQAPRPDILTVFEPHLPVVVPRVDVGVLDRLTAADIAGQYAPRPREHRMVSRLADGGAVELDARAAEAGVQRKIVELEDLGCTVIVVLSAAVFRGLRARRAWLIEPDRFLPALVAGLAGTKRVGLVNPLESAHDATRRKWTALQIPPSVATASPYAAGDAAVAAAAADLKRGGAELLHLDAVGFVERHRKAAAAATGLPVLLSSDLLARITASCLTDAV